MNTDRRKWWREAHFGLFVHWGLYSELGGVWQGQEMDYIGEWTQSRFRIPNAEMEKIAASFNPACFDAREWVTMAKRAGMGYIMVTAKHHEGFAMYHSASDKYNIVDATPFGRDPIKELSEECARQGVRLCLYYSQALDWHERDAGGTEPDNPPNFGMSWGNDWDFPEHASKNFDRFFERKVIPQLTELLTGYGPIGAFFFDCPLTIEYRHCKQIDDLVSSLQPDCLTNSRLGAGFGDIMTLGDNQVPGCRLGEGYECISTINDTWGYKIHDHNWKTRDQLLGLLTGCCAVDVNYLLNIGPMADGTFPQPALEIMDQIGEWMSVNRESIYASQASPFPTALPSGPVTSRGDVLYLHMQNKLEPPVRLYGIKNAVKNVECLGKDIGLTYERAVAEPLGIPSLTIGFDAQKLDRFDVIKVTLDGPADVIGLPVQVGDEPLVLPAGDGEILNTEYTREWRFLVSRPGRYKVYVTTASVGHSEPWAGGHKVRFRTAEGLSDEAVLRGEYPSDAVEDLYYPKSTSGAGEITFRSPGEHWIILEATEIVGNGSSGLSVCGVTLDPTE